MAVSLNNLPDLVLPEELDELARFRRGRSARLARRGLIKAIILPGGDIRFRREVVEQLLAGHTPDLFSGPTMKLAGGGR
jgi:hypothetical protein